MLTPSLHGRYSLQHYYELVRLLIHHLSYFGFYITLVSTLPLLWGVWDLPGITHITLSNSPCSMTPTEHFYSCLYRVSRFCLLQWGKHQLPFSIITRLNHFTLSHYGSNGCLSTLKSYLTVSTPRLTTSDWLNLTRLGFLQLYMCNRTGAPPM